MQLMRASSLAHDHQKKSSEQDSEIKNLKTRVKKLDQKAQSKGQNQARGDRKVHTMQESIDNLRKELAEARRVARKAEELKEEAQRTLRTERQNSVAEVRVSRPEKVVEVEKVVKVEPVEEQRPPDEGSLQRQVSTLAHSEDHLKKELIKFKEEIDSQQKRFQDGRREWAQARRKYEDIRRAYIITKGQLDITQDMLAALEAHTGVSSSDGLLAKSGRAQKRHEIQQHRAEQKMQAEMPEVSP